LLKSRDRIAVLALSHCIFTMKADTLPLTAIVLAGGHSSRMGRDKALLEIQGSPLIRQVCQVAQSCASRVYVVTPWPEKYQDILKSENKAASPIAMIREVPFPGETKPHGPLVGFAQGLALVETEWVLLLACDLPRLSAEVVQEWVEQLVEMPNNTASIALLPHSPKGWEPLCGFYRRQCLPLLTAYINQGGRSFQHWLAQHPVAELAVSNREVLFNCNTPADLEQVKPDALDAH
jgi:molybdopterin-guanine dinucleotide biosynthesis protein A